MAFTESISRESLSNLSPTERIKFAQLLRDIFPALSTDEDMNGGDTVQTLSELYQLLNDEQMDDADTLKDRSGAELPRCKVTELALRHIRGSMSMAELAEAYLSTQSAAEIVEWATDEFGLFPPTTPWVFDEETKHFFRLESGVLQYAPSSTQGDVPDEEQIRDASDVKTVAASNNMAIERLNELREQLQINAVGRALAIEVINSIEECLFDSPAQIDQHISELAGGDQQLKEAIEKALKEMEAQRLSDNTPNMTEFESRYSFVANPNPHAEEAPQCHMWETFEPDISFVRTQNPRRIWTLIDGGDSSLYLSAGLHVADRLGYFITNEEWDSKDEIYRYAS